MTLELFFSIDSFIILLVVMFFVIKPYLTLTSTCSGGKPREQRDLEAGIPWNNEGAGRTGELGRQRVPVQHDERLCPGMHQDDSGWTYSKVDIDDDDDDDSDDDDDAVSWHIV
ncbi:hypothetical protein ABFA07_005531 [Porites harrisoni]